MSQNDVMILGDSDRLWKMAQDIVEHYEKLTGEKPEIVQKGYDCLLHKTNCLPAH